MKILHAADLHLGLTRYGSPGPDGVNSRIREGLDALNWLVEVAMIEDVDLTLLAGDIFDSRHPRPLETAALAKALRQLGEVVIIGGTHDGASTIGLPESHTLRWIEAVEMPGVHCLMAPTTLRIQTKAGPADLVALPYPHSRTLDLAMPDLTPTARKDEIGRRAESFIRGAIEASFSPVRLFIGHVTVEGALLGTETRMRRGWDVVIDGKVLEGFDYAALGHIHRQQQITPTGWYAGSTFYGDFSEEGQPKGALLVDVTPGEKPIVVRSIPYPGARPVQTVRISGTNSDSVDWGLKPGAMLRVVVQTEKRPEAAWKAALERDLYAAGCHFVRIDVEIQTTHEPLVERSAQMGAEDRLRAWLREHKLPVEPTLEAAREIMHTTGGSA